MAVNVVLKSVWDDKGIKNAQNSVANLSKNLGRSFAVAGAAAAAAGAAMTAVFAKNAVSAASSLEESTNAVNVAFGAAAESVLAIGENSAKSLGIAQSDFNQAAVRFSAFAEKVAGQGGDVAGFIGDISTRATDFASVFNIEVSEALQVFQSGLSGEAEPLKRFGINLLDSEVKAYALRAGIISVGETMDETQKVQARYGLLMEATNKTAGDFANTSDSLANQQRILKATFTDLQAEVGSNLLPIMQKLLEAIFPLVEELGPVLIQLFEALSPILDAVIASISPLIDALSPLIEAFIQIVAAIAPMIEEVLPVFIELIDLLVPVIVTLIDTFLPLVEDLFPSLIELIQSLLPFIQILTEWWQILIQIFGKATEVLNKGLIGAIDFLRIVLDGLYAILGPVYQAIKPVLDALLALAGIKPADLKKDVVVTYTEKGQISGEANRFANLRPKMPTTVTTPTTTTSTKTKGGAKKETAAQKAAREQREGIEKARKIIAETAKELAELQAENTKELAAINADYLDKVAETNRDFSERLADIVQQSQDRLRDAYRGAVAVNISEIFGARTTQKITTEIKKIVGNIQTTISRETEETVGGSVDDLVAGLKDKLEKSRQLLANSAALASAGFSQTFIEQVVGAGTETGNELAKAILEATPETQKELSDLFKAVETESETGMDALAKSIYDKAGLATTELKNLYNQTVIEQSEALKDLKDQLDKDLLETNTKFKDAVTKLKEQMMEDLAAIKTDISSLKDEIQALIDKMNELAGIKVTAPTIPATAAPVIPTVPTTPNKPTVVNQNIITVKTDPTKSAAETGRQVAKVINKYTGRGGGLKIGQAAV